MAINITRKIILLAFITSMYSCNKPYIAKEDFEKLWFSSSGCFGNCPIMQLEIKNTKDFNFHGIVHTDVKGFYSGVLSDSLYSILMNHLELIKNEKKQTDKIYLGAPSDGEYFEFKFILKNGQELKQDWLSNTQPLENFLLDLYKQVKLIKVDTIQFK